MKLLKISIDVALKNGHKSFSHGVDFYSLHKEYLFTVIQTSLHGWHPVFNVCVCGDGTNCMATALPLLYSASVFFLGCESPGVGPWLALRALNVVHMDCRIWFCFVDPS